MKKGIKFQIVIIVYVNIEELIRNWLDTFTCAWQFY